MYKQGSVFFIFLFLICLCNSYGQITSSVGTVSGCAPLLVTYTAPANAVGTWDFDNSTPPNPSSTGQFIYTAGTYTVTYDCTNGATPDFTVIVNAYASPTASFSMVQPVLGCAPKTVTFTNLSSGASISQYLWSYGDGGDNTTSAPSHTYPFTVVGSWTVSLQISNIYSCTSQYQLGTVNVFLTPTAVISSNPQNLSSCTPPFSAVFNAANSAGPNLTYAWNFGNGQTSTSVSSPQNYAAQGNYNVTLTVTSNGCASTATSVVVVNPTTLTATVPQTVCLNTPFTATLASNQPMTTWNLGGGIISPVPAGVNTGTGMVGAITNSGVVTLTISAGFGACQSTLTRTVYVQQVTANFSSPPPSYFCSSPTTITLQNLSINATQFSFSVPLFQQDPATPTIEMVTYTFTGSNPTFTIPLFQGSQNQYSNFNSPYSLAYAPSITLVATSPEGCSHSVVHTYDSITRPTASFYKDKMNGCAPLSVTLYNNSYTFPFDPIVSYTWCNGAVPPSFTVGLGNVIPQTVVYPSAGTYSPYLIIQTAGGCADISFTEQVTAADPPAISFSFTPSNPPVVCPNVPVQIVNTTPPTVSNTVNHWHVESDDGYFSGCINDPNPSWKFNNVGVHSLTMSAYVDGCRGEYVYGTPVTVLGPLVSGVFETNCTNRQSVNFNLKLQSATSATVDFDDGSPTYTTTNGGGIINDLVTHVFPGSGDYNVLISGSNPITGCPTSTYSMLVKIRNAQAALSGPTVACMGITTSFSANASVDVRTGCSRGYVWYVDNLPPRETASSTFTYAFPSAGDHTVKVWVKDLNSCTDTYTRSIRISSVTPSFTFASSDICVNTLMQTINTSSSVPLDPIVSQIWTFGDFQTSNLFSPSHLYTNAVYPFYLYNVSLNVTNSRGCTATSPVTHTLKVSQPNTFFSPSQYNICVGPGTVNFNAQPTPGGTYTMTFGPAMSLTSTSASFNYTYTQSGTFSVTLRVRDGQGCEASGGPVFINAQITPTANFMFSVSGTDPTKQIICSPKIVNFADQSIPAFQTYTHTWNLYPGVPAIQSPSVSYYYNQSTTQNFAISHTVTTSFGCSASITRTFTLYNPRAKITVDKSVICLRDAIKFTITDSTASGIKGWQWDYGDQSLNPDTVKAGSAPPSFTLHPYTTYPQSGSVLAQLIYYSAGYACRAFDTVRIKILKVDADFKRNAELATQDSIHCLRIKDDFTNTSPNSGSSNFLWGFGNGDISTLQSPGYIYTTAGIYQVTLVVTATNTCKGISVKNMTVNPLPVAAIVSQDSVCQGTTFDLVGIGTSTAGIRAYQWTPVAAVNNPNINNTTATPNTSVSPVYSLTVTDNNNCVSDAVTHTLYIQPPAPQLVWDTTVIVGQPVPINGSVGPGFTYSWSPFADLSCPICVNPISTSTVNITYSVEVEDRMGCFRITNTYTVFIDPQTSVDVPTAFTPNGDGVNDFIFPDGWGIKTLHYFKIFNRWGQLLFETTELKTGWDGTFNGVPQNMDTYVYQVSVETYLPEKPLQKTSSFKLIR